MTTNWKYQKSKFEYEEIFPDTGWPWAGHKSFAYDLVSNFQPRTIVELGTHRGTSFFSFCQGVKDGRLETKLFAIDTWKGDEQAGYYKEEILEEVKKIVDTYYHDLPISLLQMTFDDSVSKFMDGSIDLLHIDGLHTYEAVKHDFENWIGKVSENGVVLLHDIEVGEGDFGVYKLWEELKEKFVTMEFHHSYGLGILFKNRESGEKLKNLQSEWLRHYSYLYESSNKEKITSLADSVHKINSVLIDKENEIEQNGQLIKDLAEQKEQLERNNTEQNSIITEQSEKLEELRKDCVGKDIIIDNQQKQLEIIHNSITWKAQQYLDHFLDFLLGKDSNLRHSYNKIIKGINAFLSVFLDRMKKILFVIRYYPHQIAQNPSLIIKFCKTLFRYGLYKSWQDAYDLLQLQIRQHSYPYPANRPEDRQKDKRGLFDSVANYDNERLTITAFIPFDFRPNIFGGGVRVMNVYRAMSEHFNINLVGLKGYDNNPEKIVINDHLILYMVPISHEFYEKLDSEEKKLGVPLHDILITDNYRLIPNLIKICNYLKVESDIFISSHPYFFKMLLEFCSDKVLIYESLNVDYELKKSYFNGKENLDGYLSSTEEVELLACQKSDLIFAVSNNDAENLHKRYGFDIKKLIVVPNGIDVYSHKFISRKATEKETCLKGKKVIFIGSAHVPNFEAVDFILEELAPKNKEINYIIIGNLDSNYQTRAIPDNVEFMGIVDDATRMALYESCDLAVNPMFSGSGTNLKVLEYAAYGIPLVSTSFGMRGLEVFNDYIYLTEKENFLETIIATLSLPHEIKEKNSAMARRICEKNFDKSVIISEGVRKIQELFTQNQQKKSINIAIEGRIINRNMSGTERYISELIKCVPNTDQNKKHNYLLINNSGFDSLTVPTIPCVSLRPKLDLYHRTYQIGSHIELAELLIADRSIFTFLDLISCKNPDYFPNANAHKKYVELMELSLNFSNRIIAISKHAKNDIIETFGIPEEKIDVVYLGLDLNKFKKIKNSSELEGFREEFNLPDKYLLCVGTDYPHKNLKNIYTAFAKIMDYPEMKDYSLVTAGNNCYIKGSDYLEKYLEPIKERVISLGHFPDEKMALLYNAADIFVFPSLYEGFGLPVLEAFACEIPVVCSNATSLPEVAGDAALLVDAKHPEQIANAITEVIKNPKLREDLISKGRERAKQFTWEKCAESTLNTYNKTLSQGLRNTSSFKALSDKLDKKELGKLQLAQINAKGISLKDKIIDGDARDGNKATEQKIKMAIIFLEYDDGKYKNSFESFFSYVEKIDNCEKEYFIIDNLREGNYCKRISDRVYRIGGDNSAREFSGWQKGLDFIKSEKIDYDIILFANDSFLAYGWNLIQKDITSQLLEQSLKNNYALGHLDTKNIAMQAFGYNINEWLCTNCFFIPRKIAESLDTMISVDEKSLNTIIADKYSSDGYFLKNAALSESYKNMIIEWLTSQWHSKFEINEKTWEKFRKKTQTIINESLLTAKIKELGFEVKSYNSNTELYGK